MAQGSLSGIVIQPSHCMMTSEVTLAQPSQWVMEPLLPSAGNTRSSTKVEVSAADKIISPMIWTQLFLKAQGIQSRRISSINTTKVR